MDRTHRTKPSAAIQHRDQLGVAILVWSAVILSGCESDTVRLRSAECDGAYPPTTVDRFMENEYPICGSVSVYGYLRMDSGSDGLTSYTLVPGPEFLANTISYEEVSFVGIEMDFSAAEFAGDPLPECVGEFVVASGDVRRNRNKNVLAMNDSAALVQYGPRVRRLCRS